MSRWKNTRPLPLLVGGLIAAGLAIWLLPKPTTETDPVRPVAAAVRDDPGPTADPRPTPVPSAIHPEPDTETVPEPEHTGPTQYPVSSRGFQAAMRARYDDIITCYYEWHDTEPEAGDSVLVRFFIEPGEESSYVDRVEIMDSTEENPSMEDCVLSHLEDIEFQASDALTIYTFPFNFGQDPRK